MSKDASTQAPNHYFVDEAGDLTLFARRGRVLLGTEGVSWTFMLGVVRLENPEDVARRVEDLRASLLKDPYFRGIHSMHPAAGKTARAFHAKDDHPDVRREVFRLLPELGCKVQIAIRRKEALAEQARVLLRLTKKKQPMEEVYFAMTQRLFSNLLHKAPSHLVFAHRGKSNRIGALHDAIARARRSFARKQPTAVNHPLSIQAKYPHEHAGLQVIDYYLWALQRLVERREDRFFESVREAYSLVLDMDDTRTQGYGEYFTKENPLTLERLLPAAG